MKKKIAALCIAAAAAISLTAPVFADTEVNFYMNADSADEVFATGTQDDNGRVTVPEDPERGGYIFSGWYTDDSCTDIYSALKKYDEGQSFYAGWLQGYTFEAENTQLTGLNYDEDMTGTVDELGNKKGQGYSSNVAGKNLIVQSAQASGGAYVSNLYISGSYLDFEINSDAEADAKLYLVLSCEFTDMTLSPDMFTVEVNGEEQQYNPIELTGADLDSDLASGDRRAFTTHYISDIKLNEGENLIRLIVNNDTHPFATGTVNALAPMVDAIEISSNAVLTMQEYGN